MDGGALDGDQFRTVLQRMAGAGRAASPAEMTPARALALGLARAAQDGLGLTLEVQGTREARMTLADLPEAIADRALLMLVEGPGEAMGLVALSGEMLAAIIEMQTTGRLGRVAPPLRRATRTDAAMAADFVDAALSAVEAELTGLPAEEWAAGFRYASWLPDVRPLGLLLDDVSYRVWQIEMRLGEAGTRPAAMLWAVPATGSGPRRQAAPVPALTAGAVVTPAEDHGWTGALTASVMAAPTRLDAVLHRLTLPLSTLLTLAPGMEIPLPGDVLVRLRVEARGRYLGSARLGQNRGMRALRLTAEEPEPVEDTPATSGPVPDG